MISSIQALKNIVSQKVKDEPKGDNIQISLVLDQQMINLDKNQS